MFSRREWLVMNITQRLTALQELENKEAFKQKRHASIIIPQIYDDHMIRGAYYSEINELHINIDDIYANQPDEALYTCFHEGRHAYQHSEAKKTMNAVDLEYALRCKDGLYEHYINYKDDPEGYHCQFIEVDAGEYAKKMMNEYNLSNSQGGKMGKNKKTRVFIDGQEGTTGLRLRERLSSRPDVELLTLPEGLRKDPAARSQRINEADVVFLCLPDAAASEAVRMALPGGARIIDASTAHRTAPGWVYGLPELSPAQRDAVISAERVSVPGCHATGFVALVAPLVAAGIMPPDYPVTAHSITGYTGGGKKMIAEYEAADRPAALSGTRVYGLTLAHKHLPEMQKMAGLARPPLFDPILGDFPRGMLVCVPLPGGLPLSETIHMTLAAHYKNSRIINIMPYEPGSPPDGGFLDPQKLAGSDLMQLFVFGSGNHTLLIARLDNLGKGASGAAVQCFNLMTGAEETEQLTINS